MPATQARKGGNSKQGREARRPKKQSLPGMEDSRIKVLDDLAEDYAEIRDQRIALNQREHDLKEALKLQMHKHNKTEYRYGGITVKLIAGEEDVKVKIKAEEVNISED